MNYRYTKLSLLAIAAFSSVAVAAKSLENDATSIGLAKISLQQAIALAEQHVAGKATRAEFEYSKLGWVYDVEVVGASKVFDVRIDASKGTVLSSAEDAPDQDDEHDKAD